ncbi:M1 family aminopeptidase [Gemmatimonadota bacterium Y43]|uniref:M1 family aminopeptidase n=1 Tax=Gaopeijia maritima TaxID=3119007 RepID=UPI00328EE07F
MNRSFATALVLPLLAACADATPAGLEPGVSRVLAEIRAATISEVAYHVRLDIPADRAVAVEGSIEASFVWNDPESREIVLDFKDPEQRVRSVSNEAGEVSWRAEFDHIVLDPDDFRAGEENRVEIEFEAGDEALNRNDEFLYTLFVPDRAHFSLPVFDQPDLKARVSWELTVPEGWVAVANGPAESGPPVPPELAGEGMAENAGDSTGPRTYTFAPSRPIPTYLMAFAAGRFTIEQAERDGRRYRMYHRETDTGKVERNRAEIFDLVARSMAWMEDYTGIDYPFEKYDFVLIPPFQYGGMEHPGAVFYRASSLFLDESATQNARMGRASLIAHETAHMWFGDLVTMRWFDDVWTKEVFANFLAAKMVHPSFPEVDHDLRFLLAHHPAAYGVDRTAGANPVRQPLENLREAGTLYGAIIYQKAPIAMRQLELRVGERLMQVGLQRYLENHAYGNAAWPDLIAILDERTPADLQAWSRMWVEEPGRPTLRVTIEGEPGAWSPVVEQSDPFGRGRLWPQELLLVESRGLRSRVAASLEVSEARQSFPRWAGRVEPRWILPNGRGVEYGLFVLDDPQLYRLLEDVAGIPSPLLRGAAWMVIRDALLEGKLEPAVVLDRALFALQSETDEQLVGMLAGVVTSTWWSFLTPEQRSERAPALEAAFRSGMAAAETASLKATWYQGWRSLVVTDEGIDRLRALWAGDDSIPGLPLAEQDFTTLAVDLAVRGVPDVDAVLDEQEARITNPDRRERFAFIRPALSPDEAEREAFFASLADADRREREPWVISGLSALTHPLRQEHAVQFLRPGLDLLEEIQATGDIFFPGRWLDALIGGHQTPEASAVVAEFLEDRPDLPPRLKAKVLQSYDGLRRAAAIVHGDTDGLTRTF